VAGAFAHDAPDRGWVADVTQHPTAEGGLYFAVVLDLFQRKVVGWKMNDRLDTDLVLATLQMAQQTRRPPPEVLRRPLESTVYGMSEDTVISAWSQGMPATLAARTSAGVFQSRVFRGRVLS
jgi:transposase InsO family protein